MTRNQHHCATFTTNYQRHHCRSAPCDFSGRTEQLRDLHSQFVGDPVIDIPSSLFSKPLAEEKAEHGKIIDFQFGRASCMEFEIDARFLA